MINLRIDDIHINNLRVIGAGNNWNKHKQAVSLMANGLVDVAPLITNVITLDQYEEGLDLAKTRPEGFAKAVFSFES